LAARSLWLRRCLSEFERFEEIVKIGFVLVHPMAIFRRGVIHSIVARMLLLSLIRVAEPWSVGNVLGAVFLVVMIGAIFFWGLRRR
jgi:hypothetical protein